MQDLADSAALVTNLDLVISVDTAMAHLAGALGKPVWILNRHAACWRWLEDRADSPSAPDEAAAVISARPVEHESRQQAIG